METANPSVADIARAGYRLVIDTREQKPLLRLVERGTVLRRKALVAGDYAMLRDDRVAAVVERKSHADAWGSVLSSARRARLHAEFVLLGNAVDNGRPAAFLLECTQRQLGTAPRAGSRGNPNAVIETITQWCNISGVELIYSDGREDARRNMLAFFARTANKLAVPAAPRGKHVQP